MNLAKYSTYLALVLFLVSVNTQQPVDNNYPIIGIATIPAEGWDGWEASSWNYIAASYVKFLESAGAQVVPVNWDLPTDQLDELLGKINGILFTGGGTDFGNSTIPAPVYHAFEHIVSYVLQQNQAGNHYPLWGTCQGFEIIARILSNNMTILTPCTGCVYVNTNNYPVANYNSKLLNGLPNDLQQKITFANISLFDHVNKLDIAAFSENPTLSGNVTPVAYSIDQAQVTYVSMYESRIYPIYAVQFHQEKSTFEWKPDLNINHDLDAVRFEQFLGTFFVEECRKNQNTFPDNATYLIYNYNSSRVPDSTFTLVYFFPVYNSSKIEIPREEVLIQDSYEPASLTIKQEKHENFKRFKIEMDIYDNASIEQVYDLIEGLGEGLLHQYLRMREGLLY